MLTKKGETREKKHLSNQALGSENLVFPSIEDLWLLRKNTSEVTINVPDDFFNITKIN